ncbi:MAG: hypothetical protein PHD95_02575 [Candidatus ainarchaeum sp.]|nr:hypothetical protein [Candidatus ainarchaeum sp.]
MLFEFFSHLISLDLAWIIGLIMGNLLWLFLLAAYVFITHEGKKVFWGFIFLVGSIWIVLDIFGVWRFEMSPIWLFLVFAIALDFFIANTNWEKHKLTFLLVFFFGTSILLGVLG